MAKFCGQCGKSVETGTDRESGRLLCSECGAVLGYSASALPRGTVIAGYRIEDPVGQGGMGVVYRAVQINLQRPAALKILSDELADEPGFVESFFHEAHVAANLTHPNIVQAYAAGTTEDGINYFAMELVEGESLDAKLRRTGPLAPVPAVEVALQLAGALEYAWNTRRMCHGDIKPDNILVTHDGTVKLADLGLARSMYEESAKRDVMVTPLYAAPELISGKQTSAGLRSDMYSFGAALYHITVGHPPFESGKVEEIYRRHLTETPVVPADVNGAIPAGLSRLIMRLLEKDPEKRPADWTEVVAALSQILDGSDPEELSGGVPERTRPVPLVPLFCGAAAVLILAVVSLFWFAGEKKKAEPVSVPSPAVKPESVPAAVPSSPERKPASDVPDLHSQWLRWKREVRDASLPDQAKTCIFFLQTYHPDGALRMEVLAELERVKREEKKRLGMEYRRAVGVFLGSLFTVPVEGRAELTKRFRLYCLLKRQGRLPHLSAEFRRNRAAMDAGAQLIRMRLRKLDELGGLPCAMEKKESPPPEPVEPPPRPVPDPRKSEAVLEQEFRAVLRPHVRHFSPEELLSQMAGFARRYADHDCLAVRKARAIAENLGDAAFMKQVRGALDELHDFPLSRFGENASLTGIDRGSIRVTFDGGRIKLRRRVSLMPENIARLRSSLLDAYRDPVLRKKLKPGFLYVLCLNSIFYDTPNAIANVRAYQLDPARKSLMESILRDISVLSGR